jgi:hypothetical protein
MMNENHNDDTANDVSDESNDNDNTTHEQLQALQDKEKLEQEIEQVRTKHTTSFLFVFALLHFFFVFISSFNL